MSLAGVLPKDVEINGEEQIQRYLSSEWAERGFCKQCGSSLFYHSLADDEYYFPAGLFDEIDQAKLTTEIFYDQKPAFFHFKGDYQPHNKETCPYCQGKRSEVGQSGVFGLLDEERMTIKPEGFDHLHTRGGGLHRLREDNSKWKPLGIGGGEDKEED